MIGMIVLVRLYGDIKDSIHLKGAVFAKSVIVNIIKLCYNVSGYPIKNKKGEKYGKYDW